MPNSATFTLEYPPTANNLFRTLTKGPLAGRRVLTGEAKDYRKSVGKMLNAQGVSRRLLTGKLSAKIVVRPPDRRARDLDNCCKAIFDALKVAELFADDSDIDELHVVRGTPQKPGHVVVTIAEIAGEATETKPLFEATA